MDASNTRATKGMLDCTRWFDEYKETVSRLFPALPKDYVDTWSVSAVDALALTHFLECYPRKVVVLDVGTFVGVSAFHFASQSKVLQVVSVDANPTVADEISDESNALGGSIDTEPLRNLRIIDVARAALAEYGVAQQKIHLRVGTVGSSQADTQRSSLDGLEEVEIPVLDPSDGVSLVAFLGGLHTKEEVQADLVAIFEKNPHAVAILDNCRGSWGLFVQAGVVSFMEKSQDKYHFQLLGDLGPSVATCNLGIVYPDIDAAEVMQTLEEFGALFTERLDPLRLLRREEELTAAVGSYNDAADELTKENTKLARRYSKLEERNSQLEERNSKLKERNSKLEEHNSKLIHQYSSRRYKLVDILSAMIFRFPGVRRLVRRKPTQ